MPGSALIEGAGHHEQLSADETMSKGTAVRASFGGTMSETETDDREALTANIYQWAILFNDAGDVLCLQERDSDEWTLPGGPLAADAEPEAEEFLSWRVEEEVGPAVRVITPIHTSTFEDGDDTGFGVGYLCEVVGDRTTDVSDRYGNKGWLPAKSLDEEELPRANQYRALQAAIAWREWLSD